MCRYLSVWSWTSPWAEIDYKHTHFHVFLKPSSKSSPKVSAMIMHTTLNSGISSSLWPRCLGIFLFGLGFHRWRKPTRTQTHFHRFLKPSSTSSPKVSATIMNATLNSGISSSLLPRCVGIFPFGLGSHRGRRSTTHIRISMCF